MAKIEDQTRMNSFQSDNSTYHVSKIQGEGHGTPVRITVSTSSCVKKTV